MTKTRHRAREVALQILYRYEVALEKQQQEIPTGEALARELNHHFDHFGVDPSLREFSARLVIETLNRGAELDGEIETKSKNWRISRMSIIDRCLLRMALAELRHFPDTPRAVVIDEAVELAKQFGTSDSAPFVNGILDAMPASS